MEVTTRIRMAWWLRHGGTWGSCVCSEVVCVAHTLIDLTKKKKKLAILNMVEKCENSKQMPWFGVDKLGKVLRLMQFKWTLFRCLDTLFWLKLVQFRVKLLKKKIGSIEEQLCYYHYRVIVERKRRKGLLEND